LNCFLFITLLFFFFFNTTSTSEIYSLSLHDALPICNLLSAVDYATLQPNVRQVSMSWAANEFFGESSYDYHFNVPGVSFIASSGDRKSTRLNSSHGSISYAVFCLKKKKKNIIY